MTKSAPLQYVNWNEPIYSTQFESQAVLEDWVLEGGKSMSIEEGVLTLESEGTSTKPGPYNHLVAWLETEVPGDFYLEFDFRPKNKQQGLAIIFFNTRGTGGESIFDPSLSERDGTFIQYHSGDLNGYHISYWSGVRNGSNLRKNEGFALVQSGEDPISLDKSDQFHRVGIYKNDGTIRYYVDGELALEYQDDGTTNGPVWNHSGWIGLRQMDHAHWTQYRNLSVYPLQDSASEE